MYQINSNFEKEACQLLMAPFYTPNAVYKYSKKFGSVVCMIDFCHPLRNPSQNNKHDSQKKKK